jgi:hypothetical protein
VTWSWPHIRASRLKDPVTRLPACGEIDDSGAGLEPSSWA